jgi:hypothetical protein
VSYDAIGNLIRKINRKGHTIQYVHLKQVLCRVPTLPSAWTLLSFTCEDNEENDSRDGNQPDNNQ